MATAEGTKRKGGKEERRRGGERGAIVKNQRVVDRDIIADGGEVSCCLNRLRAG
jgi:hypothetical protein